MTFNTECTRSARVIAKRSSISVLITKNSYDPERSPFRAVSQRDRSLEVKNYAIGKRGGGVGGSAKALTIRSAGAQIRSTVDSISETS